MVTELLAEAEALGLKVEVSHDTPGTIRQVTIEKPDRSVYDTSIILTWSTDMAGIRASVLQFTRTHSARNARTISSWLKTIAL